MPPIKHDEELDVPAAEGRPLRYEAPDGALLAVEPFDVSGRACLAATPEGWCPERGVLVVLDGTKVLRRIGRLVERGAADVRQLPKLVGVDADEPLADYTPWRAPAFREGAPGFGGAAESFLADAVLPALRACCGPNPGQAGPVGLFGYSLAGLFGLSLLMMLRAAGSFDRLLLASPSTWYPGFVNCAARSPFSLDPQVAIACGVDEGADHPEPIRGVRQDTDRLVSVLTDKLSRPARVLYDERDHHGGLSGRLEALLALW